MGWKKFQEHYRVPYSVHVVKGHIAIGSPYVPVIATVDPKGKIKTDWQSFIDGNKDLSRIVAEIQEDPELAIEIINAPDEFSDRIPVYSYRDGEIVTSYCEKYGWPNNTHDGQIMYENEFFKTPKEAIKQAIKNQEAILEHSKMRLEQAHKEIQAIEADMKKAEDFLQKYRAI